MFEFDSVFGEFYFLINFLFGVQRIPVDAFNVFINYHETTIKSINFIDFWLDFRCRKKNRCYKSTLSDEWASVQLIIDKRFYYDRDYHF